MPEFCTLRAPWLAEDQFGGVRWPAGADFLSAQTASFIPSPCRPKHQGALLLGTALLSRERWPNPMPNGWSNYFDRGR
jgi:hypothetical protein